MKVLVIDDSKFQCVALRSAFRRAGHEVITAADSEGGLRAACEKRPEPILLDMLLPKLSGVEVLRTLKQEEKDWPTVIVNCDKLMEEGAAGYVEKSAALLEGCWRLLSVVAQVCPGERTSSRITRPRLTKSLGVRRTGHETRSK